MLLTTLTLIYALLQSKGETGAVITPLMLEAWGIRRELLSEPQS
jgi:hypothetical protein